MHTRGLACDARIEGPNLASVAGAFVLHGREVHASLRADGTGGA